MLLSTLDLCSVPANAAIPPQVYQPAIPASDDEIYIPPDGRPSPTSGHVPVPSPISNGEGASTPIPSLGAGGGGSMAPVLKFNGYGEFSGLLYHSPHSVVYEEELYPTALHLFEARKFLDHRPDLADRVRQCERVEDVTAISAQLADFTRRDWGNVALSTVSNQLLQSFFVYRTAGVLGPTSC